MNKNDGIFLNNVQKWALYCPLEAKKLLNMPYKELFNDGISDEEVLKEAKEWFSSLGLKREKTIFIYGVGKGVYLEAAKEWLKENPTRDLVFLEDDFEVIGNLMGTEQGSSLLNSPQARLYFIDPDKPLDLRFLPAGYFLSSYTVSALRKYQLERPKRVLELKEALNNLSLMKSSQVIEEKVFGRDRFSNFYRSLFSLANSKDGHQLFQKFKGIPAVICGSGPSFEKNLDVLKTLKNKALFFSEGSTLNQDFLPHFGIVSDRFSHLLMNQAYEVPFFYGSRSSPESLAIVHGEHLLIQERDEEPWVEWVKERFGLVEEGFSKNNHPLEQSLLLARALGCNPIILVGVDLALKEAVKENILESYPLYPSPSGGVQNFEIEVEGENFFTTQKWINLGKWITQFTKTYPDIKLFNVSEGIKIPGTVSVTLDEITKQFKSYDYSALLHAQIQMCPLPFTQEEIKEKLLSIIHELEQVQDTANRLKKEFAQGAGLMSSKAMELLKELNQSPIYDSLLKRFNDIYVSLYSKEGLEALIDPDAQEMKQEEAENKKREMSIKRFDFLSAVCQLQIQHIRDVIGEVDVRKLISEALSIKSLHQEIHDAEEFQVESKQGSFKVVSKKGTVLAEIKEGESNLYYLGGNLYSKQHFKNGLMEGKQEYYYENGQLKSLLNYSQGSLNGIVELYFPTGVLKRKIFYKQGKKNGPDQIFNFGGILEIESHFRDNLPVGNSRSWHLNGQLAKEVIYNADSTLASIKAWTSDGVLLPSEMFMPQNTLQKAYKKTEALTTSIEEITKKMSELSRPEYQEDIDELQSQMKLLTESQREMAEMAKNKEGPSAKVLGKEMDEATDKMARDIELITESLKILEGLLKKNKEGS